MSKQKKQILLLIVFIAFIIAIHDSSEGSILTFGNLKQHRDILSLFLFKEEITQNGSQYLLTPQLIIAFLFFLGNVFSGLIKNTLKTFVWTMSLGITSGTAVYAFSGRQIRTINSLSEKLSAKVIMAIVILACLGAFL